MSFFNGIKSFVSNFGDAVKAGSDFNPLLEEVMNEIEQLHSQGKLDDVLFKAEQNYTKEHGEYKAKGSHTNAFDSKQDLDALMHFMKALKEDANMPADLQEKAGRLIEMKEKMTKALGPFGNMI